MIKRILKGIFRRLKNAVFFLISWEKNDNKCLRKKIKLFEFFNLIPAITSDKQDIIVSLTTYGERFSEVHYTLFSLFRQNVRPDKIVLWLDENEFTSEQVTNDKYLSKYIKKGLEVNYCKNFRSYKKFVPTLNKYPDSTIIICDDDAYYNKNWLKLLLQEHKNYPNEILCHVGTRIAVENSKVLPYKVWKNVFDNAFGKDIVPIGVGGTLLKKSFFHSDICDDSLFAKLSKNTDDLWLWSQAVLNNTQVRVIINCLSYPKNFGEDRDYQKLYIENAISGNDVSINNLISYYPKLKELLNLNN